MGIGRVVKSWQATNINARRLAVMSKPLSPTSGANSAGIFIVEPPRASDMIGRALRSAFQHDGMPEDFAALLKNLDQVEATPARS
ncbi:hypothetical protein [Sphingomonas alpina]|uniref:Uncharacterized protein n=1 Tax=Sphingomonas alpina TaxID=653931 RepID=A0A7H0LLJ3_9SPHN|nr:hypothetical protein [Sphingomonas alpina]QNQ10546.1 hypothetical protein H3Z74_04855 [Sphingomonas alpina]